MKTTFTVHEPPAATVTQLLLVIAKGPETVTLVTDSDALPVLLSVTDFAALVEPTTWPANCCRHGEPTARSLARSGASTSSRWTRTAISTCPIPGNGWERMAVWCVSTLAARGRKLRRASGTPPSETSPSRRCPSRTWCPRADRRAIHPPSLRRRREHARIGPGTRCSWGIRNYCRLLDRVFGFQVCAVFHG